VGGTGGMYDGQFLPLVETVKGLQGGVESEKAVQVERRLPLGAGSRKGDGRTT
jgi:hypothetical protein